MISIQYLSNTTSSVQAWQYDGSGNAINSTANALNVYVAGGALGATADSSSFTAGTSTFTPDGGVFNDALAALTSGQQGTQRITSFRAAHVNLRDNAGAALGVSANPLFAQLSAGAAAIGSVSVSNFPATQVVSGTVAVSTLPSIPAGTANIGTVVVAAPTVATLTQVTPSTTSATLVAANTARKGLIIDMSLVTKLVYIAFAATASASAFTYRLQPGSITELNMNLGYTGAISVLGVTGTTGAIQVTDLN